MTEEWITVQEAATRFGVSVEAIRSWIRKGEIQAQRPQLGRVTYVNAHEIEEKRRPRPFDQDQRRRPLPPAIFPPARIE